MIKISTSYTDKGASKLMRQIDMLGSGVTIDAGVLKSRSKKTPSVATYAMWQEEGTLEGGGHIPRRPFMSHTVAIRTAEFISRSMRRSRSLQMGNTTSRIFFNDMRDDLAHWFKETIIRMYVPVNAPSTIAKKMARGAGSNPLLDTRAMLNATKARYKFPPVKTRLNRLTALIKATKEVKGISKRGRGK